MRGKILTIAGSDPSGGAGIQADIKTISALGGYAMAAITALTIQDSTQVYDLHPVAGGAVGVQVRAVLGDIPADAIKVGMMASADVAHVLAGIFAEFDRIPLVVDPVILSTSGHELLDRRGVEILVSDIFPRIDLLTPNLAEAARLAGCGEVKTVDDMRRAGEKILSLGPRAVLIKGGHLAGAVLTDLLVTATGAVAYASPKIPTRNTHGTGCTLASAIATGLGQGMALEEAVARAHHYVHQAIRTAPGYGRGKGPLNHFSMLD